MKAFTAYPREGWIRASQYSDSKLTNELARLSSENARLREQIEARNVQADKKEDIKTTIKTLKANEREMYVWMKASGNWETKDPTTLYALFRVLAPEMLVDKSIEAISRYAAIMICNLESSEFRSKFPVPSNSVKEWMADFSTLGLVTPSTRKKPVADNNEYWTLTQQGKAVLSYIRLMALENPRTEVKNHTPEPVTHNPEEPVATEV